MKAGRRVATLEREEALVENSIALFDELLEDVMRDFRRRLKAKYPAYQHWASHERREAS